MSEFTSPEWRNDEVKDPAICGLWDKCTSVWDEAGSDTVQCSEPSYVIVVFNDGRASLACKAHAAMVWADHLPYVKAMATVDLSGHKLSQLNVQSREIMRGKRTNQGMRAVTTVGGRQA